MFLGLSRCRTLFLNDNNISEVEIGAFNGLASLTTLRLYDNKLERLYANMFFDLRTLRTLELDSNRISQIEPGSFKWINKSEKFAFIFHEHTTGKGSSIRRAVSVALVDFE